MFGSANSPALQGLSHSLIKIYIRMYLLIVWLRLTGAMQVAMETNSCFYVALASRCYTYNNMHTSC